MDKRNKTNDVCGVAENENDKNFSYSVHLHLDELFNCQQPLSTVHDERLFITIHQTFELWFRQINLELDSLHSLFPKLHRDESHSAVIISRLERITAILDTCNTQFAILQTMTTADFFEFRTFLGQSSGFQSVQFRLLESALGVLPENRVCYMGKNYKDFYQNKSEINALECAETRKTLFNLVENWLETIHVPTGFWQQFQRSVNKWIFDCHAELCKDETSVGKKEIAVEMAKQRAVFSQLFDDEVFEELRSKGEFRFSRRAFLAALLIVLYQKETCFSRQHEILSCLMDVESSVMDFRHKHITLVSRMIGTKKGTGGSSGYFYLKSTLGARYKVFNDLFNTATYIVPKSYLPPCPEKK